MTNGIIDPEDIIEVESVIQRNIRITKRYWEHIVHHKHAELDGRQNEALDTLKNADEVYHQDGENDIYLYYKSQAKRCQEPFSVMSGDSHRFLEFSKALPVYASCTRV
ncbi:hypothetical protein HY623_04290 [Candidatus Uhrbacteria bacterium]|nr:hypothetical protein [Candidatus Uhrbacteria bacterium]